MGLRPVDRPDHDQQRAHRGHVRWCCACSVGAPASAVRARGRTPCGSNTGHANEGQAADHQRRGRSAGHSACPADGAEHHPSAHHGAGRAGVRTVDHGSYLDDEAIALIKATNRAPFYVPTLYTSAAIERPDSPVPESERVRSRQVSAIKDAGFRRALAAGIGLPDKGGCPRRRNRDLLFCRRRIAPAQ